MIRWLILSLILSSSLFAQQQEFIELEGSRIAYRSYGEGLPILIINGGPGMNSNGFRALAKEIGKRYRTIIYDQRGTGASHLDKIDATHLQMDSMLADIECLREHLGLEKWVVMGHSFGGMLASYYAANYPRRLKGMVLSSSGGVDLDLFNHIHIRSKLTAEEEDSLDYWQGKMYQGDTSFHTRLQRGRFLAPAYLYDKSNVPIIAQRLTEGNMDINRMIFADMRRIKFDCKPALKKFEAPVIIFQGENDIIDPIIAKNTHRLLPNSKLVMMKNCAHYGWLDRPQLFFRELYAFLDTF